MTLTLQTSIDEYGIAELDSVEDATVYVSQFYSLMIEEIEQADFAPSERRSMEDPFLYYGRYLNPLTRPYFEETVIPVIGRALIWFRARQVDCVLDLGCGLAMQSIILAALGKKVIAVDLRPESIKIGEKRKRYYERILGRDLEIEFIAGDFQTLDLTRYEGQVDGIFSMSAFSYIQPLDHTVALIERLCSPEARVFLFEENTTNIIASIFRRRPLPKPSVVVDQFEQRGFTLHSLDGTCALPKQLWVYRSANGLVRRADGVLRQSMRLAFSYALQMERSTAPLSGVVARP